MRFLFCAFICVLCLSPIFAQEGDDLSARIATESQLGVFAAALVETEWEAALAGVGAYTVFAPTDDAFAAAFARLDTTQEEFFTNSERLSSLLSYHILAEAQSLAELRGRNSVMPQRRSSLVLSVHDGELLLNDEARILRGDIVASNGWLHIVDTVLLAPGEFAVADPDNAAYLRFGIVVVVTIMALYLASVSWRWRMVRRETDAIRRRLEGRGTDA